MEQERQAKGGERYADRIDLRGDLLALLREPGRRLQLSEALFREATAEGKSTNVLRAYELVREIVGTDGEPPPETEPDLRTLSDGELRAMLARLEAGDGDGQP